MKLAPSEIWIAANLCSEAEQLQFWSKLEGAPILHAQLGSGIVKRIYRDRFLGFGNEIAIDVDFQGGIKTFQIAHFAESALWRSVVVEATWGQFVSNRADEYRTAKAAHAAKRSEEKALEREKLRLERDRVARDKAQKEQEKRSWRESSCEIDLLLFDLDGTLLDTSHAEHLRGPENVSKADEEYLRQVRDAASSSISLISEHRVLQLAKDFPRLKFGIVSRAPRAYVRTMLASRCPAVHWASVVAYEDVVKPKPHPDGIRRAAAEAGVKELSRVAMIGDDPVDIRAAYNAACRSVLYMRGWPPDAFANRNPDRRRYYRARELLADAILEKEEQFEGYLDNPSSFMPYLDHVAATMRSQLDREPRSEHMNLFRPRKESEKPEWVGVQVCGRYFVGGMARHELTRLLLSFKDNTTYPQWWTEAVAAIARKFARNLQSLDDATLSKSREVVITVIPAKHGRPRRLESLLEMVSTLWSDGIEGISVDTDVYRYLENARSHNKDKLTLVERFEDAEQNLRVHNTNAVKGKRLLVIDDISTSGATLFWASKRALEAGAVSVESVALAKSIGKDVEA